MILLISLMVSTFNKAIAPSTICVTIFQLQIWVAFLGLGKTYFSCIFLFPLYWMKSFHYVVGLSSSQEIWTALKMTLTFASNTRIAFLFKSTCNCKVSNKVTFLLINFYTKAKSHFDELIAAS